MHVHVGLDDPDKAIHVANGMRVHLPVLLALSANSPFWRARRDRPGLDAHADLPRLPARRASRRRTTTGPTTRADRVHGRAGVIEDYTYLWYDVRPHPNFGTVEVRVMDAQTRVEHTLGAGRADPGDGQGAGRALRGRRQLPRYPHADGRREQVAGGAPRARRRARRPALARARRDARAGAARCSTGCAPHAEELGSAAELAASRTCSSAATARRASWSCTRRTTICARSSRRSRRRPSTWLSGSSRSGGFVARSRIDRVTSGGPDLFVICKNCGSEVSPYITECPYCGSRLRKRAPKLDRDGRLAEKDAGAHGAARRRRRWRRCGAARSRASGRTARPYATIALVVAWLVLLVLVRADVVGLGDVAVVGPLDRDWWQVVTAPFAYDNSGYAFVALFAIALFGWLARAPPRAGRRRARCSWPAAPAAWRSSAAVETFPLALGGNGAALALLVAWAIPDLRDAAPRARGRRGPARRRRLRRRAAAAAGRGRVGRSARRRDRRRRRRGARLSAGAAGRRAGRLSAPPMIGGVERAYTDAELDAALAALSEEGRLREAQALVARAAPQLHRVLDEALAAGGWFGETHEQAVDAAADVEDPRRASAGDRHARCGGDAPGHARRRRRRLRAGAHAGEPTHRRKGTEMELRFLGHAAFALSDGGTTVLVDPFLTGNPRAAASADELDATTILLTHGHARPPRRHGRDREAHRRDGRRDRRARRTRSAARASSVRDPNLGGTETFDWGSRRSSCRPGTRPSTPSGTRAHAGRPADRASPARRSTTSATRASSPTCSSSAAAARSTSRSCRSAATTRWTATTRSRRCG